ncbi:permease [Ectobacillus panaciterrae]|uniref:permease n=1 Tax=Ectobacillus panaciterrae TaxID=363872 RepID=UPI00041154EB|nr:permease [Ectobacillus panaciterrae]
MPLSRISKEVVGLLLIALFIFLFFFIDSINLTHLKSVIPKSWLNVNTIFLSIFFEAIPFVLIGVFISAFIQTFISEDTLKKVFPKNYLLAIIPAALIGLIFPVCECAIVPIVRRLIKKGMPLHVGMVVLVSTPIINPVVFASTYYAFSTFPSMTYYRLGLAGFVSVVIGLIVYFLYGNRDVLRESKKPEKHHHGTHHVHRSRWQETLYHASDEFFDTGKFLLIGAFVASLFQTFFDRSFLMGIASDIHLSPLVMMGFGYVLSICSEADAFIASSLSHTFSVPSLLAFLVFGPMIDFKNTLMLFAYFKKGFVIGFICIVVAVVYLSVVYVPILFIGIR